MSKLLLAVSDQWVVDYRLDALAAWAARMDCPILAVHVVLGSDEQAGPQTTGEKTLKQIGARLKQTTERVETLLLFASDVVDALIKTAEEYDITMIVVGLSRQGVLERLIEGNIQRDLLNASRWPILALPVEWDGKL
ncbi:MAG: universal stress protein [Phycisphaerales bacterium]|nr:universal stress protein [Phycisphaerales bacterium]